METERGLQQFLLVFNNNNNENNRTTKTVDIIRIFGQLLTHTDEDCVLNATGTLGTIVCRLQTLNFRSTRKLNEHFQLNS